MVVAGQGRIGTSSMSGLDLGGLALKARGRKGIPYLISFNASTFLLLATTMNEELT